MNVSQAEFQNMKEEIVKDLIARLMDERGLTMQQAFDAPLSEAQQPQNRTIFPKFRLCV